MRLSRRSRKVLAGTKMSPSLATAWALVGCTVVAALSAAWPAPAPATGGPNPFDILRDSSPPGPVVIASATTGLVWRAGAVPPTKVTVFDETATRARCETWWILAPAAARQPWETPVMEAEPVSFSIRAGGTLSLPTDLVKPASARPGVYRLSFWVHCMNVRTGAWAHSDGASIAANIEVVPSATDLRHRPRDSRFVWIEAAKAPPQFIRGRKDHVQVTIANGSAQPLAVQAWCYLSKAGATEPWRDPSSMKSGTVKANLTAAGLTTVSVVIPRLPPPGRYELSVWLHQQEASNSLPVDGAWLGSTVVVGPAKPLTKATLAR